MTVYIDGEIVIARPIEAVCDFVADERNEPAVQPDDAQGGEADGGPDRGGNAVPAVTMMRGRPMGFCCPADAGMMPPEG